MGSIVGKAMDENMKKQQEFMMANQITVVRQHKEIMPMHYRDLLSCKN